MAKLTAKRRTEIGTNQVRRLRETGDIPGIVYGHGQEPEPITLHEHDVEMAIQHGARLLEMDLDGGKQNVLIKDVQWDTFGNEVLHVDFARVNLDERVQVTVPVMLAGTAEGVKAGGVLQQLIAEIALECAVRAIPEEIRVPVGDMELDSRKHLSDIELPEGMTLLDNPDELLCIVAEIAEEAEPEEGAGESAEPELIGGAKEEETEGES